MTRVDDLSRSLIAFEQNSTMVVVLEIIISAQARHTRKVARDHDLAAQVGKVASK